MAWRGIVREDFLEFETPKVSQGDLDVLHFNKLIYEVFELNERGASLLKMLKEQFIDVPVCTPGSVEGMGFYREGQNSVIRYFFDAIKNHKDEAGRQS
jgi:hypothetical protein